MPVFSAQGSAIPRLWVPTNTVIATIKDPHSTENFTIDWSTTLSIYSDTISASSWLVPNDINTGTSSFTATTATVSLAGGILGQTYFVANSVTLTTSKQILVQNFEVTIQST